VIPSTNLADGFKAFTIDLQQSSRKIFYDVAGKPYVTCARCGAHVKLPEKIVPAVEMAGKEAAGAGTGAADTETKAEGAGDAAAAASKPPVNCTSCKNPVEY